MATAYRIEWAPTAIEDLDAIVTYIALHDGIEAAEQVYRKIRERAAALERTPFRCRVVPELHALGVTEYRELIVGPYRVCIRITRSVVGIVAVLDGRRDLEELLLNRFLIGD